MFDKIKPRETDVYEKFAICNENTGKSCVNLTIQGFSIQMCVSGILLHSTAMLKLTPF